MFFLVEWEERIAVWAIGKEGDSKSLQVPTPCQLPCEQKDTHSLFSVNLCLAPFPAYQLEVLSLQQTEEEKGIGSMGLSNQAF